MFQIACRTGCWLWKLHAAKYSLTIRNYGSLYSLQKIQTSLFRGNEANQRNSKMQCGPNACCGYSKDDLKKRLTPEQYQITQEKDTERPFTGKYYRHEEKGTYNCVVCGQALFSSETKYPSPCGWPAFFDVVKSSNVKLTQDLSHDMMRNEVSCSQCGSHLGHLFDDGPKPTGKRYCINSAALDFQKATETSDTTTTTS